jgi:hypothetical protein
MRDRNLDEMSELRHASARPEMTMHWFAMAQPRNDHCLCRGAIAASAATIKRLRGERH